MTTHLTTSFPPDAPAIACCGATIRARLASLQTELAVVRAASAAFDEIVLYSPRSLPDVLAATWLITRAVHRLDRGSGDVDEVSAAIDAARARAGVGAD